MLDLGDENQVHVVRRDPRQILQSHRALVDPDHALGLHEVHRAQGVADHGAGGVLLGGRHGVLEVEDHAIGAVQAGVHEELGLRAGQVQPRTAQAVPRARVLALRRHRQQELGGAVGQGTLDRTLQPRRQDEGQRSLVHDVHLCVGWTPASVEAFFTTTGLPLSA